MPRRRRRKKRKRRRWRRRRRWEMGEGGGPGCEAACIGHTLRAQLPGQQKSMSSLSVHENVAHEDGEREKRGEEKTRAHVRLHLHCCSSLRSGSHHSCLKWHHSPWSERTHKPHDHQLWPVSGQQCCNKHGQRRREERDSGGHWGAPSPAQHRDGPTCRAPWMSATGWHSWAHR
jgi:hypothetical protein